MTDGAPSTKKESGLALSGGGFRATLFHLGAVWRMNELGLLENLDRITSVSGGSILAGYLGLKWGDLRFVDGRAENFAETIAHPIQDFCGRAIDVRAIVKGKLDPFRTAADYVADAYDKHLFNGATLHALPDDHAGEGPRFIIYATNMQSGVSFRFSRPYMADYRIGMNKATSTVRIADAVAASSAFPPILTPKILRTRSEDWEQDPDPHRQGDLWSTKQFRSTIYLTDGGVYDNMGLETIFDRCDPVFVSAAGAPFSKKPLSWLDTHSETFIAMRTTDTLTEQTRALRRRMLISRYTKDAIGGSYWNISSSVGSYGLSDPIVVDNELTHSMRFVRTRLNRFSQKEQGHLINWGYVIADTSIRKWAAPQPLGSWSWPSPEHTL